ncbi:tRNA dihydrouridine synthase [Pseudomonas typographi]|uniref:tRNA dihydrouridine synthase n=1 Tax=Pseudomonas typographi TaxID=2715964 RepID=UPI0016833377|nr:tRNA-dihydrouridine synthase [Pseudomonas typographi]MBD1550385.1 tRNA dihydrouridine(16) synthase DusC [Pseudomonas typographi]MBD1588870.1 tRNA dihydrouridine(16) synthase DusC [Pseudomonas typographi]
MQIALAPMEGLVDDILREVLTEVGGIDWCVTEFIRVSDRALQPPAFLKLAPELARGSRTRAGVPLRVQLLGSDPSLLGESAAAACELGAPVIDLNFGCPAKTVNRSRGGAVLLNEPELLHAIVSSVRRHTPAHVPVTAKMRLGYASPHGALDCARALESGGAKQIVVHARTKLDGYKPPAHWEWVARVQGAVKVPVYANGDIWSVADWQRCRQVCGAHDVMLGRGLVSRPDLARQIAAAEQGVALAPMAWEQALPLLQRFWRLATDKLSPRYAPGRLKQWVAMLTRSYPEASTLFEQLRRETDCQRIARLIGLDEKSPTNGLERREAISI